MKLKKILSITFYILINIVIKILVKICPQLVKRGVKLPVKVLVKLRYGVKRFGGNNFNCNEIFSGLNIFLTGITRQSETRAWKKTRA